MTQPETLKIDVKAGILTTIASSVYSSTVMKIREAVSNSKDNEATSCIMYCGQKTIAGEKRNCISILDDGLGISYDRFKEIFKGIGCGSNRKQIDAYSYFGLGLMSILRLGEKVTIVSKVQGKSGMIRVSIDSKKLFSSQSENINIGSLGNCIKLYQTVTSDRKKFSLLKDSDISKYFSISKSFTEIIVDSVYDQDYENISNDNFDDELRKFVPLEPNPEDLFFKNLKDADAKTILKLYSNKTFYPTINFYWGMSKTSNLSKLYKYYPQFETKTKLVLYKTDCVDDYSYFILHSNRSLQPNAAQKETGLWIRNKNFLVREADFLTYQGGKAFIHNPLRDWLYAEISHKNMKGFLEVSRNYFITSSPEFKKFRESVINVISPLNTQLRFIYEKGVQKADSIVDPFSALDSRDPTKNPLKKVEKTLLSLMDTGSESHKKEVILKTMSALYHPQLEKASKISEEIKKKGGLIELENTEDLIVYIDSNIPQDKVVEYDAVHKKAIVRISSKVFDEKRVIFFGDTYKVNFVKAKDENSGISISLPKKEILINIACTDIINYSITFIDVLIIVEYAHQNCNKNTDIMKNTIIRLLGGGFQEDKPLYENIADYL